MILNSISPYLGLDCILLIILFIVSYFIYEKTCKNTKYIVLFLCIISALVIHIHYENIHYENKIKYENTQLYTHIYFNDIKTRLFSDGLEEFNNLNENNRASRQQIMDINNAIDNIIDNFPSPYKALQHTVYKYYYENTSKIPQQLLQELNEFVNKKIEKNKLLLINKDIEKYFKQIFFDTMSMIIDYSNKIDSLYSSGLLTDDKKSEEARKFENGFVGYFKNRNKDLLVDYNKAISCLDKWKEEFMETKNIY